MTDALLTFHMRAEVKLVVTGGLAGHPGQFTLSISEREFPFVCLLIHPHAVSPRFEACTLDYARSGETVELVEASASPVGGAARSAAAADGCGAIVLTRLW